MLNGTHGKTSRLTIGIPKITTQALLLLLFTAKLFGQGYADKDYYLVDSLNLEILTQTDRLLVDSCLKAYHSAAHDTDRINAINKIVEESWDNNLWPKFNQWIYNYVEERMAANPSTPVLLSLRISLAGALNNIGFIHDRQGNIPLALEYYHKSLKIREEISRLHPELVQGKQGMANSYHNIGFVHKNQGAIPLALEYYHKSLKILEEISRLHPEFVEGKHGMANSYNNIGMIHNNQGDMPLALEYFRRSLKIREEISDKQGMAQSYNNIGIIHKKQGDIPLALESFHKGLKIREKTSDKQGMANSYNNIGAIHRNQGDIPLALEYCHKSLKIKEEISDKQGIATSLANIGTLHLEAGELASARKSGERGLKIARELGFPDNIQHNAGLLSKVAKQQGNFKQALEMYELQILYRDSMNNEETQKASIRQQTKYEFEKAQIIKEQEQKEQARIQEEELSRRDNLQYSVILIVILIVFGGVLSLGFINVSPSLAEGLIFFAFLILFEFLLVLSDPYLDNITGGAPAYKLLTNALLAALIFPLHSLFERMLKKRLIDHKRKTTYTRVSVN